MQSYDVVVIGGGPGGYVAAIRAAQLNKKVVLIEEEKLGGTCLNWGCIPTKTLLKSAHLYQTIKHANEFGISVDGIKFNFNKILDRSKSIVRQLGKGIDFLLKKHQVSVIYGTASFIEDKKISVVRNDSCISLEFEDVIIATGGKPRSLENFIPDKKRIITSKEALFLDKLPKSIVIVGSGAVGIEFASFFNALEVEVVLVEMQDRILQSEDYEIAFIAEEIFCKNGIKVFKNTSLISYEINSHDIGVVLKRGEQSYQLKADLLLMAVGVVGNIEGLNLNRTKIKVEKGRILVDQYMRTSEPGIYAIGDVTNNSPWLAHKASHEGIIAAETICNQVPHPIFRENIPGCIYSFPEIASVGLTEKAAIEAGYSIKIGKCPLHSNGKALVEGYNEGLIKTIFDVKTGELLGAHLIGPGVTELIQGYVIAKTLETTESDLMHTIFPHPTLSEMLGESVLAAYDKAIHL